MNIANQLKEFCDLCKNNYEKDEIIKYKKGEKPSRWVERIHSNYLIEFFKNNDILKSFLKSVSDYNIYCECDENLRFNIDELGLEQNYEVKKQLNKKIATDICIEGKKFICIIENKFGCKGRNNQCLRYKEYILNHYPKKTKIFIYLDSEHNSVKIPDDKFILDYKNYGGYYKAWFGHNVLNVLSAYKNTNPKIEKYCNFLEEVTLDPTSLLSKEITKKRNEIMAIIKNVAKKAEYLRKYDLIDLGNGTIIDKHEYIELFFQNEKEIIEYTKKRYK